ARSGQDFRAVDRSIAGRWDIGQNQGWGPCDWSAVDRKGAAMLHIGTPDLVVLILLIAGVAFVVARKSARRQPGATDSVAAAQVMPGRIDHGRDWRRGLLIPIGISVASGGITAIVLALLGVRGGGAWALNHPSRPNLRRGPLAGRLPRRPGPGAAALGGRRGAGGSRMRLLRCDNGCECSRCLPRRRVIR